MRHTSHPLLLRGVGVLALTGLGAFCVVAILGAQNPNPERVFRAAIERRGAKSFKGRAAVDGTLGKAVLVIQVKAPDKQYVKVFRPDGQLVHSILENGDTEWSWAPGRNQAFKRRLWPREARRKRELQDLGILVRNAELRYLGQERHAGRTVHKAQAARRTRDDHLVPLTELWADVGTWVVLRRTRPPGSWAEPSSFTITKIEYTGDFAPGTFDFRLPGGARLVELPAESVPIGLAAAEKRCGFKALRPPYLPRHYEFVPQACHAWTHENRSVLSMAFGDGLDRFSIFQRRADGERVHGGRGGGGRGDRGRGGRGAGGPPPGGGQATVWQSQGFLFILVGPLPDPEKAKVRDSYR